MRYRQLGSTGIKVSEVGFGAWQLGNARDWSGMSVAEAIRLVHEAIDQGCTFFDTAPNYGLGNSESLLGEALVGRRSEVVINTKFGHHSDGVVNFDPSLLRKSVESSLGRLKTDYLDSVLLHNPPLECLSGRTSHFHELQQLKKEGKIRAYGASVDSSREIVEILRSTESQIVEVMFNLFHQEPALAFREAEEKGVGLIVKVPLDSGWLSGKYDENSKFADIRSRWTAEQVHRRATMLRRIREMIGVEGSLVHAALSFILSFKEVSTIIPGAKNVEQLHENLSASGLELSTEKVQRLQDMWTEQLESDPMGW